MGQVERSRNPWVAVADDEPTHSFDFAQDDPVGFGVRLSGVETRVLDGADDGPTHSFDFAQDDLEGILNFLKYASLTKFNKKDLSGSFLILFLTIYSFRFFLSIYWKIFNMNRNIITEEVLEQLTDCITEEAIKNPSLIEHLIILAETAGIPIDNGVRELADSLIGDSDEHKQSN